MKSSLKKLNGALTNWVIKLHHKGYTDDFRLINRGSVQCIQSGENFDTINLHIKLVHCAYDILTRTYQYIHTIDTDEGYRGLLIANDILILSN